MRMSSARWTTSRSSSRAGPAVIVYENRWALGLADTWRREGARLIADGGISADDLVDALDATERS